MRAENACALFHSEVDWNAIDWRTANRNVRRLQVRIVKATQEGRWGKVKALQRLLTHSYSGKVLAVRRVTENRGKNTPGVDGKMLHPTCHWQIHSQSLSVVKPRPEMGVLERLEPDEVKASRPVLRGGGGGNAASLPGLNSLSG